jgi:hypothetical protein
MARRQRLFCKLDVMIHYNKKLRVAPRATRDVFILAICANGDDDDGGEGIIAADDISVERVMDACKITDRAEAEAGIAAAFDPKTRLLEHLEDGRIGIVGWAEEWGRRAHAKPNATRQREWRDKQKRRAAQVELELAGLKAGIPIGVTVAEPLRSVTSRNDGPRNAKVTDRLVTREDEDEDPDPKRHTKGELVTFRPNISQDAICSVSSLVPLSDSDGDKKLSQIAKETRLAALQKATRETPIPETFSPRPDQPHIDVAIALLLAVTGRYAENRSNQSNLRQLGTMLIIWGQLIAVHVITEGITTHDVMETVTWTSTHDFWSTRVLGPESLIKNWGTIRAQMSQRSATPLAARWTEAWQVVQAEITRTGKHRLPTFADPQIGRAVRSITWEVLCDARLGDPVIRARFRKAFEEAAREPVVVAS